MAGDGSCDGFFDVLLELGRRDARVAWPGIAPWPSDEQTGADRRLDRLGYSPLFSEAGWLVPRHRAQGFSGATRGRCATALGSPRHDGRVVSLTPQLP